MTHADPPLPTGRNINLQPGQIIEHRRQRYAIVQCLDVETILLRHLVTGGVERVSLGMITLPEDFRTPVGQVLPDLLDIPDDDWKQAQERFEIIRPILETDPYQRSRDLVERRASESGHHASSLYRWMAAYQETRKITSLMPKDRKDKGSYKLAPEVEVILQDTIEDFYLTTQRRSIQSTCQEVMRRCRLHETEHGVKLEPYPHYNTVRNRILERTQYIRLAKRLGKKTADNQLRPHKGEFPDADYPLATVQIDHTQLDIILVDDYRREPLGRPWLTAALDIRTRLVTGYALSFDPPDSLAVGLCLVNAVLPKNALLLHLGIEANWPIQGLPRSVHVDNAKEFHGLMLERACQEYGIDLKFRPRGTPHMGGHVERFMDTVTTFVHGLPGTTFHNPKDRGEYRPADHATLSLDEFEKMLVIFITRVYHERFHQGLQTTPLARYNLDVLGTSERPGVGTTVPDIDQQRLRYDFLPFFEHTVQNYGVLYKHIHYYSDSLKPWIDAPDPEHDKRKRKFISRYDPRDMSTIYFYDPEAREYLPIPFRDSSRPARVSRWELRAATKRVRDEGLAEVNEDTIFGALGDLHQIEADAKATTRKQRKNINRRDRHMPVHLLDGPAVSAGGGASIPSTGATDDLPLDLAGFDDVEVDTND